jgi:DNA-binding MarR family transcriptional regulator
MTGIKDDHFFVVYKWMLSRLHLKGVALQIFAIIYGFDRDGEGSFTGSLKYLMNFTNTSKNTVLKALKELMDKGYIIRTENIVNRVRFCIYQVNTPLVQNLKQGSVETESGESSEIATSPSIETEPNNIYINNTLINNVTTQDVIDLFNTICISFTKVKGITSNRKREILSRLESYSLEDMKTVFMNAESSPYLKGKNDRGWSPNFDWMLKEDNFVKLLEGNYADRGRKEVLGWTESTLGDAELEAIQRVLMEDVPTEDGTCEL